MGNAPVFVERKNRRDKWFYRFEQVCRELSEDNHRGLFWYGRQPNIKVSVKPALSAPHIKVSVKPALSEPHIKVSVKPFQRLVGIQRAKPVVASAEAKLPLRSLTNKAK